jgi:crotonobetainyl-CoA:carnitine CoA-transferase CaiB-like acyl-CoA transferase
MLDGVRVLDLATLAAAPLAATYLGEFGADVIKVEQPTGGDPIRSWGSQRDGVGLMWKSVSRNKRAVTLDLRVPAGQYLLRRLVEHADVVVANTRPQTLAGWGLDYESLRAVNDRIVMLHITGYGLTGPKAERPGFGTLGEAMSGFANITGEADGPPTLPPFMLADGVASLNAAYAVMMALYHRDVHGAPGQLIDINLIDPLTRLLEQTLLGYASSAWCPRARATGGTSPLRATPTAPPTGGGWRCRAARPPWHCACSARSGAATSPTTSTSPTPRAGWPGPARLTGWSPTGWPATRSTRRWRCSRRRRLPRRRSTTSPSSWPTSSSCTAGCSSRSVTASSAR